VNSGGAQLLHLFIVNVDSRRTVICNRDCGASISDEIAILIAFLLLPAVIHYHLHRCLRCSFSNAAVIQTSHDGWLTVFADFLDGAIELRLSRIVGLQVAFQEPPRPFLKVLAILPNLLSALTSLGFKPVKHSSLLYEDMENPYPKRLELHQHRKLLLSEEKRACQPTFVVASQSTFGMCIEQAQIRHEVLLVVRRQFRIGAGSVGDMGLSGGVRMGFSQ
jgi:hypothetical protein